MRLARLALRGFKSFADPFTFTFPPGLTAIVGPNGAGKSNLVDAILWVIGEQSARTLRGERMEDVIFHGTETRRPLGMAEVSLTLEDVGEHELGSWGTTGEVTVTRRLFRSGESEYAINKIPCRLRDVRETLLAARIGAGTHTIVEQGHVEAILAASPVERRSLVEETAETLAYQVKKAEAERKLEAAEQNLLRLRDILVEVTHQRKTLASQAQRAKRYQALHAEVEGLERHVTLGEYRRLEAEARRVETAWAAMRTKEAKGRAELERVEADIEAKRASLAQLDERLVGDRQQLMAIQAEQAEVTARMEGLRAGLDSWRTQQAQGGTETEELAHELEGLTQQQQTLEAQRTETETRLAEVAPHLEEVGRQREAFEQEVGHEELEIEEARALLFEQMTRLTEARNALTTQQARLTEARRRITRLTREEMDLTAPVASGKPAPETEAAPPTPAAVLGTVEQVIQIPSHLRPAIEAALGERLQGMILRELEEVAEAAHAATSHGRRQVLIPSRLRQPFATPPATPAPPPEADKAESRWKRKRPPRVGRALDLVSYRPEFQTLAEALLGHVWIVEDLPTAFTRWAADGVVTWVTLAGEVIEPTGVVWTVGQPEAATQAAGSVRDVRAAQLQVLQHERQELEAEVATLETALAEGQQRYTTLAEIKEKRERHLAQLQDGLPQRREEREGLRSRLEEARRLAATLEERLGALRSALTQAVSLRERLVRQQDRRAETQQTLEGQRQSAEAQLTTLSAQQASRAGMLKEVESRHATGETAHQAHLAQTRELEQKTATARQQLAALQQPCTDLEVQRAEVRVKREEVAGRLGGHPRAGSTQEDALDLTEATQRLTQLQERLSRIGPVNMAALDEYQALDERYTTMTDQETDLTQAITGLRQAIVRINQTIQTRFLETLQAMSTGFQETFTAFFGGGTARLLLLDEEHPLESGIQILAQPPGKKLGALSLLSGGEKSLTAIALLFASFRLTPSPFYVLDEIDAALDEENTRRFGTAVRELVGSGQLLLITHNKRTMEAANCLYGATMVEPGLSKILSVHLTPHDANA